MSDIQSILILRFSSLGDIVMTTPMIRALRRQFPYARIDMVVREDFIDIIKNNPHLDQKIAFPKKGGTGALLKLIQHLRKTHYDLVYDAHKSLRTALLMPFINATHKRYYQTH